MRRILPYTAYIVITLSILIALVFGYWVSQDEDVLEIKNQPTPVRTIREHPTANGVIILLVDYCKRTSAVGEVTTSFVSPATEIFLPTYVDKQDPVCQKTEVPVLIPPQVVPGTYHIHYRVEYKINPIKQSVIEFDSQPFEITESQARDK